LLISFLLVGDVGAICGSDETPQLFSCLVSEMNLGATRRRGRSGWRETRIVADAYPAQETLMGAEATIASSTAAMR
jgi:hypothetical protein